MGGVAKTRKHWRSEIETLELVTRLVEECDAGASLPPEVCERARAAARALGEPSSGDQRGDPGAAASPAVACFAAELMGSIAVDLAAHPRQTDRLLESLEGAAGIPRALLGHELLRQGNLLGLPAEIAIEVQLQLLRILTRAKAVSLWSQWPGGELRTLAGAGSSELETAGARREALRLLTGEGAMGRNRSSAIGVRIDSTLPPPAALVIRGGAQAGDARLVLAQSAMPTLRALLDAQALAAGSSTTESSVLSSVERRLARLRYDLHDGPQQDVHLLAQDLRLFRDQLRRVLADGTDTNLLLGRLDDLEAQLVALDGDLRRLSSSVQSPFLQPGSLPDVLRQLTQSFATRTGVNPEVRLSGDFSALTDSQQITLLALVREALSNIRKHSDATTVRIAIEASRTGLAVTVTDNGRGFDPEAALIRAARAGRLGLVGMHERVRMLGGLTRIESRDGGPTVISAHLPAWTGQAHP